MAAGRSEEVMHRAATGASRRRTRASRVVLAIGLLAATDVHAAMNCRITVLPLSFGIYAPGDIAPLDVTGSLELTCTGSPGTFVASLSTGASSTFAERQMTSGTFTMGYNLYADASRSVAWGDGTGGSVTVSRSKPGPGREVFSLPLHGRIFPGQSVGAGTYVDDILITIEF